MILSHFGYLLNEKATRYMGNYINGYPCPGGTEFPPKTLSLIIEPVVLKGDVNLPTNQPTSELCGLVEYKNVSAVMETKSSGGCPIKMWRNCESEDDNCLAQFQLDNVD